MTPMYHLFHLRTEELRGVSGLSGIQTRYNAPFIYQSPSTLFNGDFSNGYPSGIRPTYNLPFDDQSQYISGFLSGYVIPAETLRRIKEHNFTVRSEYYLGQHILEDYEPKTDEPFILKELYGYNITLSGPGFNNTDNHSRFEINGASGMWWKPAIKDLLTVKPDFSWDRNKEIDTDFYLKWKGDYSYASGYDNSGLVVFSLSGQSYSGVFSGESFEYNPYYGLMYGPIDNIHVFKEPVEKRISGIVTEIITSGIVATVSDTASGVVYGIGTGTAVGTASYTFDDSVSATIYDIGYGNSNITVSRVISEGKTVSATGTAKDAVISGLARGNAHDLLLQKYIDGYGLAKNVAATIPPTTFEISRYVEGSATNTYVEATVTKTADGIRIGGTGKGTAESVLFSCEDASGMVNSITIEGEVNDTLNNLLISGIITQTINGIDISGMASGYANNVSFTSSSSTTVSQMMRGQISEVVNNIPINGPVSAITNGVSVTGKVSGYVDKFTITHLGTMTVPDFVFSGYINGEVQGKIRTSKIVTDDIITDNTINDFKSRLYNNIEGIIIYQIGENELNFFGHTKDEIKTLYQNAINSVVDYNSIHNIISSAYLSKDAITDLTDKILFDMTIANGNYIKGDAKFLEVLKGTVSIDGDASLGGDIVGGEVTVNGTTGSINNGESTGAGTSHRHDSGTLETASDYNEDGDPPIHWHDISHGNTGREDTHTHSIGGKSVSVNGTTGSITGGKTSITNGTIDIDEADFTETIPNETEIEIRGSNINRFRDRIIFLIESIISSILSNIQIDKILYDTIDEYEVTGNMSGVVSGYFEKVIPTRVSGLVPGTGTGKVNKTIQGRVTNNVTHDISGIVFNQVSGEIEGEVQGTASALAYCVGSGYDDYDDKIILSASIDDSFSDMINYYEISGISGGVTTNNDIINPGGRGQLINHVGMNLKQYYDIIYSVGSYEDKTNTIVKDNFGFILTATSGFETEYTPLNNNFGRDGGNIVQNSFDLYQKNEPENGFARIIYGLDHFNTLEITASGTIEVLPDEPASIDASGIIYNQVLANNEAEVYYRITRRGQELNLDESTFNGKKLSEYTIKYEEPEKITPEMSYNEIQYLFKRKYKNNELYITEIDNQRRKLTFLTPSRSVNNDYTIQLYLEAGKRKFYFAIARDNNIDKVTIDGKEYFIEDQEEYGSYRRHKKRNPETNIIELGKDGNPIYEDGYYGLEATNIYGERLKYEIEVKFKNETDSLMKEVIRAYLNDCLDAAKNPHNGTSLSISKSNNYIQTINPFIMPERDVLLFLKTEKLYILTIFVEKGSDHIIEVIHEDDTITKIKPNEIDALEHNVFFEVPIIARHFRDDKIIIKAKFSPDDEDKQFYELDREYIESQLIDISRAYIRYNDGERFHEPFVGYNSDTQEIKFFMPARDLTLYLREKDYRYKLKLLREINTDHFLTVSIAGYTDNPAEIPQETEDVIWNSILWFDEATFREGDKIDITVHFMPEPEFDNGYFHRIDVFYMKSQMIEMGIEKRQFKTDNEYEGFKFPDQTMSFTMPGKDVELVIKEESIIYNLTIHPEEYQYNDKDFISRKIQSVIVRDILHQFTSPEGVMIPIIAWKPLDIFVEFADIYQHLDDDYVISQDPTVVLPRAGELPLPLPTVMTKDKEFYQRIGFIMPGNDFTLVLKWIERLFEIDLDVNYKFVEFTDIFDSYVEYDTSLNGAPPTQVLQPRFPHYTYPMVLVEPDIEPNGMKISLALKEKIEIVMDDEVFSWYKSKYGIEKIKLDADNSIITLDKTDLLFNMPKYDLYIFLKIGFKPGSDILEVQGVTGSITLEPGIYNFSFCGAMGGEGGRVGDNGEGRGGWGGGDYGASRIFNNIEITSVTTVQYYLGLRGNAGARGGTEEPGGGGGGGGTSIIIFNPPVFIDGKDTRGILCAGGYGGHGENEDDPIEDDDGGGGGGGGNWKEGTGGYGGTNRNSGAGGPGGMGYDGSTISPDVKNEPSSSDHYYIDCLPPIGSGNGYLLIHFVNRI